MAFVAPLAISGRRPAIVRVRPQEWSDGRHELWGARRKANLKAGAPTILAELASLIASAHSVWGDAANSIYVAAEGPVKVIGKHAAVFGKASAVLGSALNATVAGNVAGVKGVAAASLWGGLSASLESARAVEICSMGEVSIEAKKEVHIVAQNGNAGIHAEGHAELCGKKAFVFGEQRVAVASGEAGLSVTPKVVAIGKMPHAEDGSAKIADPCITVAVNKKIRLAASKECSLELDKSTGAMTLKYKSISFPGTRNFAVDAKGKITLS